MRAALGEAEEDGGLSSADWAEAIADLDLADAKEMCVEAGLPVRPCMRPCIAAGAPRPVLPLLPLPPLLPLTREHVVMLRR